MTRPDVLPVIARRWSPLHFDPAHELRAEAVDTLIEAAQWAPSAGNSQPWAFLPARRGDAAHAGLLPHLAGTAARWAPSASLIVVNLCHRYVEGTDWEYSEFALYDLGQAVAYLTLQAASMGLSTRQFRAFDRAGVERELEVPDHWEVTTMIAIGRPLGGPAEGRQRRDARWAPAGR